MVTLAAQTWTMEHDCVNPGAAPALVAEAWQNKVLALFVRRPCEGCSVVYIH